MLVRLMLPSQRRMVMALVAPEEEEEEKKGISKRAEHDGWANGGRYSMLS